MRWRRSGGILRGCLPLLLALGLTACAEEPLPQRRISHDDCLAEVKLDQLKQAIARCDKVVAAYPRDPLPLNERFLLHTLADDDKAACRDIVQADALARRMPAATLDPVLRSDLQRRLADCRTSLPASTPAAPTLPPQTKAGAAVSSPAIQQLPHQNR